MLTPLLLRGKHEATATPLCCCALVLCPAGAKPKAQFPPVLTLASPLPAPHAYPCFTLAPTEAAGRVLGLGMLGELRCPSKAQCKSEDVATTSDPQQQQGIHAHASISSSSSSSSSSSGSCSSIPTSSPLQGSGHQHHHHYQQQQQGMGSKQGGATAHGASHRHRLPSAGLDPQQLQRQQQLEEEQQQQQQQQQRQLHEKGGWWRRALW